MTNQQFADYFKFIIQGIVDDPNGVIVIPKQGEQTLVLEVSVSRMDIGKVIGKKGAMASSLRTILNSAATKHQMRAVLDILD